MESNMERVNKILNNCTYREQLELIGQYEKNRQFCLHDINHFIDVARIAYIMVLERNVKIDKDIIYAAALLHDIGRGVEYINGTSHEEASIFLARKILNEEGFKDYEEDIIINAIKNHRDEKSTLSEFDEIFKYSDKLSRKCFQCNVADSCKWQQEKRNQIVHY